MPSIRPSYLFTFMAISLALAGCGDKNEKTVFNPEAGHSSDWAKTHKTAAQANIESCGECHGVNLDGGIAKVGCFSTPQTARSGFACHVSSPSPAVNAGCISCHGTPPNGDSAPNRANAHAKHLALAGVTCESCHAGGGSGTTNHANGKTTILLSDTFKAKTIATTFAYDAASEKCSGIICHGGQTTPKWSTGAIAVATDCLKCHEQGTASQAPQFNSFYSGNFPLLANRTDNLHQRHLSINDPTSATTKAISCASCHNVAGLGTQHFNGLTTPAFDGVAGSSIGGASTSIRAYIPYTSAVPSGSCTSFCHGVRNWNN